MNAQDIFTHLWQDYTKLCPRALKIHDLILAQEQKAGRKIQLLENDHVAFRTFDRPNIGIEAMCKLFTRHGYEIKGDYHFKEKKLYAIHLEHVPNPSMPKVFLSQLLTANFSSAVNQMADTVAQSISDSLIKSENFLWSGRTWSIEHAKYKTFLEESEYAAWVYTFGFRSNHFTISLNDSKAFAHLRDLNTFLKSQGIELNASGGEIKGNPDELLEQSSTLAEKLKLKFVDGEFEVPSCYYEFALRYTDQKTGKLYQGFVAASADKIFESTYVKK